GFFFPSWPRLRNPHLRELPVSLRRQKRRRRRDGEGTHRAARAALRPRHHPRIQEVEVEPVREHVAGADRGGEHQGGGGVVLREEDGVRVQGQDQEWRHELPLHLGQGHPPPWQLRRRPRQVQVQPAPRFHGAQGQSLHVPEQHLKVSADCILFS
uniref:Uncharacterized protein n=1 Tax=Oryza barthii TaxID=65489 RepID=A0A0D3FBC4_9ORYZ